MSKPPSGVRPDRDEERSLMSRVAMREAEAFTEFDKKYRKLIFSTAYKVIPNQHDCEDITNDVLITIWKKADQFDSHRGSLVTWICTTTRNRSIDRLRSLNRKTQLYDNFKESETVLRGQADCGISRIIQSDTRAYLNDQIDQLPQKQAEVIRLIYLEGLTQRQVSEKLLRPLGTVKAQMTRGLQSVRTRMEENMLLDDVCTN